MAKQYVASEVLQMAIELEKRGEEFYDAILGTLTDQKAIDVFTVLRDDEIKHADHFQKMFDNIAAGEEQETTEDEEVIAYFRSLVDEKVFPEGSSTEEMRQTLGDPAAGIRIALTLEKDAVLFFHEMLAVAHHSDEPVIKHIIDEERDHILRILKIKGQFGL